MNNFNRFAPLALMCAAMAAPAAAPSAEGTDPARRYLVVPFVALSGEVPLRAGAKVAGMLETEIRNADGLVLAEPEARPEGEGQRPALSQARALVDEAKAARDGRKFRVAEERLQSALAAYRQQAATLTDVGELQDAYALLSAVQYQTGRDDEGLRSLHAAVGLAADRTLPLEATSPLFAKVVEQTRVTLPSLAKETLTVESQPPDGEVFVDGARLGRTPLRVTSVPPGPHVWRVALLSGDVVGGVVDVTAGKGGAVLARSEATGPEQRLVVALAQNRIDEAALGAAKTLGTEAKAEVVLFGVLGAEPRGLVFVPLTYDVRAGELRRLPARRFDAELLNAGVELFAVVSQLGRGDGEPVRPPAPAAQALSARRPTLTEVRYPLARSGAGEGPGGKTELRPGPSAPDAGTGAEAPKSRAPLKKKP